MVMFVVSERWNEGLRKRSFGKKATHKIGEFKRDEESVYACVYAEEASGNLGGSHFWTSLTAKANFVLV